MIFLAKLLNSVRSLILQPRREEAKGKGTNLVLKHVQDTINNLSLKLNHPVNYQRSFTKLKKKVRPLQGKEVFPFHQFCK